MIGTLQGFAYKPKPYGRAVPAAAPAPHRRTRQAIYAAVLKPTAADEREKRDAEQIVQVRELARTMTLTDASRATGLSKHMLKRYASEGEFSFQRYIPPPDLERTKPERIDPIADAMNVLRIKAARDRGLSRKAAMDLIGISNTLLERLIADYSIDFPPKRIHRKLGECALERIS